MNVIYHSSSTTTGIDNKKKSHKKMDCTNNERERILLVEGDPDICTVYQMVLEDAGFECFPYSDSVKALKEFRPNYYDLILLDIKMPVLNGFEFYKRIMEVDKRLALIDQQIFKKNVVIQLSRLQHPKMESPLA
jgi:CheY-like chemotaxis protein